MSTSGTADDGSACGNVFPVTPALERAQALIDREEGELWSLVPEGTELFDAHTHTGTDIDGFVAPPEELDAFLARWRMTRAFTFCLDEPDRHPAFRAANDRTLAAAERFPRLVPFVRLDLVENPVEEATRCLDRGAQGIKLHLRAQKIDLADAKLAEIFALAAERSVPILIHGGRGLPPIAGGLRALHDRNPESQLIIAHAGIADMAALSECFSGRKGVFFDTSVWSGIDLLDLYSRVSPEQVVYASDYPYGQQPGSLLLALKTARRAGFSDDQLRAMLGGTAAGIADGRPDPEPTSPLGGRTLEMPITFARIYNYLTMTTPSLRSGQGDSFGGLGLALNACAERDGHPEERERIAELIACAREVLHEAEGIEDAQERRPVARMTMRLLQLANIVAVTTR
jgi:predicted TIM-barrel fold metal-dependent hydrolase